MRDGSQFDQLFKDGEAFMIGRVQATAMLVPGHTPADLAYRIDNSEASARRHAHGAEVDPAVDPGQRAGRATAACAMPLRS